MSEASLREQLIPLILELYGLSPDEPEQRRTRVQSRAPARRGTARVQSRALFHSGPQTKASPRWVKEGSAVPGRRMVLVGTSVRMSDRQRIAPGLSPSARIPGESDRDFISRRKSIRSAHARGLAPPKTDRGTRHTEHWEMGH